MITCSMRSGRPSFWLVKILTRHAMLVWFCCCVSRSVYHLAESLLENSSFSGECKLKRKLKSSFSPSAAYE